MAGNQVTGDGLSVNIAGMSKNQLYDIMSQMKTLIEQNQDQARQILIQNPLLTKALFQAQIMLGMLQAPQEIPNIQPAGSQHPEQTAPPAQQPNAQANPLPGQTSLRDPPSNPPLPPIQLNRSHLNAQPPPVPSPPPSQFSNMAALPPHYAAQPPPVTQPLLPLQPPLPPQPRPPSMPPFPHQNYPHLGPNAGFQHPSGPQLHHSQPMFHSGSRPPFSQGQPLLPNQQPSQALYQGGGSHIGLDFNQMGIPIPSQSERGSAWLPGLPENSAGTQHLGPSPPFLPGHISSGSQPPRPASLTADMEKALLQQVMSLTPEQINLLPPDQRNQVLQLQQMLR